MLKGKNIDIHKAEGNSLYLSSTSVAAGVVISRPLELIFLAVSSHCANHSVIQTRQIILLLAFDNERYLVRWSLSTRSFDIDEEYNEKAILEDRNNTHCIDIYIWPLIARREGSKGREVKPLQGQRWNLTIISNCIFTYKF